MLLWRGDLHDGRVGGNPAYWPRGSNPARWSCGWHPVHWPHRCRPAPVATRALSHSRGRTVGTLCASCTGVGPLLWLRGLLPAPMVASSRAIAMPMSCMTTRPYATMSCPHSCATLPRLRSHMHAVLYACHRNLCEPVVTWYLSRVRLRSVMRSRQRSRLSQAWPHDILRIILVMVFHSDLMLVPNHAAVFRSASRCR
ncbi:hypothetical protein PanWU01x14_332210 [Parasponia andersonii]|uniref:Uncharacterized protein n=1 Tax=Parasponia andersonii TaxID=3476 RepID=A0A2P5AHC0_PARAD|nr:hypothetical protein PanWU01x14_332210 [Parasponia andersonii]